MRLSAEILCGKGHVRKLEEDAIFWRVQRQEKRREGVGSGVRDNECLYFGTEERGEVEVHRAGAVMHSTC
jgi:hypothetical protein